MMRFAILLAALMLGACSFDLDGDVARGASAVDAVCGGCVERCAEAAYVCTRGEGGPLKSLMTPSFDCGSAAYRACVATCPRGCGP